MSKILNNLTKSLDDINWAFKSTPHKKVENILIKLKENFPSFQKELENYIVTNFDYLTQYSVETPTHFKWFIYKSEKAKYKIWLHEYKSNIKGSAGYAVVPHNHRYWFTSFVLNGGFINNIYQIEKLNKNSIKNFVKSEDVTLKKGDIYSFSSKNIHSLTDIKVNTRTFVIQSQALKKYSESFDFELKSIHRHYAFESRLKEIKDIIKSF